MKKIKETINKILALIGYHICKVSSLEKDIADGKYEWLQNFGINTIIDVGANTGGFALFINKIIPSAKIYSFEPLFEVFEIFKKNTHHIENCTIFNVALGKFNGEEKFFKNEFSPSSSFLKIKEAHVTAFPETAKTTLEKVSVKKLDSFIDSIDLKEKVLLKLDVQGYELNTLLGSIEILEFIDIIITEVSFYPLYENQTSFDEINSFLIENGFKYFGNFDQLLDPHDKKIIQADAIFIKM